MVLVTPAHAMAWLAWFWRGRNCNFWRGRNDEGLGPLHFLSFWAVVPNEPAVGTNWASMSTGRSAALKSGRRILPRRICTVGRKAVNSRTARGLCASELLGRLVFDS